MKNIGLGIVENLLKILYLVLQLIQSSVKNIFKQDYLGNSLNGIWTLDFVRYVN